MAINYAKSLCWQVKIERYGCQLVRGRVGSGGVGENADNDHRCRSSTFPVFFNSSQHTCNMNFFQCYSDVD